MGRCFVMQPFDRGPFDKRYESTFAPAIKAAGLEPYRVDRDPSVSIPIQDIEKGIRDSRLCFADISTDNPNVWFELGFAFALGQNVVLICSDERESKYPFDVQHRSVIEYETGSVQDFEALAECITVRIKALLANLETLSQVSKPGVLRDTEGLNEREMVALVMVMQNSFLSGGGVPAYTIRNAMDSAGFTDIAVALALETLNKKGMIEFESISDMDGEPFFWYSMTRKGTEWLTTNEDKLTLTRKVQKMELGADNIPF